MMHWSTVFPDRILDLSYENLVSDIETETRSLLNYCDLPWEASCLDFHKSRRSVKTASLGQVRRALFRDGVGRWENYRELLNSNQLAILEAK